MEIPYLESWLINLLCIIAIYTQNLYQSHLTHFGGSLVLMGKTYGYKAINNGLTQKTKIFWQESWVA